jgi:hypothetical protein
VQDFFIAGLPCWLIQPSSQITNLKIHKVVDLQCPKHHLTLAPHSFRYPVIFAGPASSLEKYCNIHQFACNFLHFPDPFGGSATNKTSASSTINPSSHSSGCEPAAGPSNNALPVHSGAQPQRHHLKKIGCLVDLESVRLFFTLSPYHLLLPLLQVTKTTLATQTMTSFSGLQTAPLLWCP